MSESDKSFTVSDRRHFTPDGRPREAAEPEDVPEPEVAEAGAPERGAGGAPPAAPAPEAPSAGTPAGATDRPDAEAPADFSQFLLSLGAQAGLLLSGEGLPEDTDPSERLAGARSIIAILEMLEAKTEGHRTPRENDVLEGLLFELRMAYVGASRASGS